MEDMKPIREAIVEHRKVQAGDLYNYQPGDGYKYMILVTDAFEIVNPGYMAKMVTWLNARGSCMSSGLVIEETRPNSDTYFFLHWKWIKEKFECTEGAAHVLQELLNHVLKTSKELVLD